jgi:hypothetical protein
LSVKHLTRRAQPKTDIENGNLVYLPNGQSAKSGLNKSMLDAAHGQFASVLKYVAWKLGKTVLFVDPKGTSQHCWDCLNKVPKELSERWHSCQCGESLDRDENSAKLIKKIGLSYESGGGTPSLKKAFEKKEKEACGSNCTQLTVRLVHFWCHLVRGVLTASTAQVSSLSLALFALSRSFTKRLLLCSVYAANPSTQSIRCNSAGFQPSSFG